MFNRLEADLEKASSWITTNMSGDVTITTPDGTVSNQRQVLSYTATDPVTKEVSEDLLAKANNRLAIESRKLFDVVVVQINCFS